MVAHTLQPAENYQPQCTPAAQERCSRRAWLAWAGVCAFMVIVVGLIFAAPLLTATGWPRAGAIIYSAFHPLCHQMDVRSFHVAGAPCAVCARCLGLYVGYLGGIVAYPLIRRVTDLTTPPRRWLILSILPTGIDFLLGVSGLWANTHLSRFLTALIFGSVAAFYTLPGVADVIVNWRRAAPSPKPEKPAIR